MFLRILLFLLLMTSVTFAHHGNKEFVEIVKPKFVSPNIVFVIDCSSSINTKKLSAKFYKAWESITYRIKSDEWYFSIYAFNDKKQEKFYNWRTAGGKKSLGQLKDAYRWIRANTGVRSYGQRAMTWALKRRNPLIKNPMMKKTLTVILISDGGFTEAVKKLRYKPIYDAIAAAQKWRKDNDLFEATILTIGLENKEYWSYKVKRPDSECQEFMKTLGEKYNGGYYLVRDKKK